MLSVDFSQVSTGSIDTIVEDYDIEPSMYNSNMVLYYMNALLRTGRPPKDMRDPHTKTDYAKVKRLVNLDQLDRNRKFQNGKLLNMQEVVKNK